MKIALIGKGKTGGEILNLYPLEKICIFDSKNPISLELLQSCDVAIAFVPSEVLQKMIPLLIKSKIPVVSGATGQNWDQETIQTLEENNLKWITASNFSLGMRIVHQMIKKLNMAKSLFDEFEYKIHEIHHTQKLDAPSGTAKSWNGWIDQSAEITHARIGDVVGDHEMKLITPFEEISVRHQALDRKIFAKGALWAAQYLVNNQQVIPSGLNYFENITEKILNEKETTHGL